MKCSLGVTKILTVFLAIVVSGCATTVETTMNKEWEKQRAFNEQENKMLTQMKMTNDGDAVTLISPGGVQSINENGEVVLEKDRGQIFTVWVETSRGVEELTDKVTYIYVPHRHAFLEFNYATFAETVSLIDLNDKSVEWVAEDLKWSLERYQTFARMASKGLNFGGQAAAGAASEILLPERFVGNLTKIIPELDALVFKTLDGLSMISLEDGSIIWTNEDFKGGIAELIFDEESNSLVAVNSDDDAFSIEGLQFSKQLMRIDVESGATIWSGSYDGNIREKLDGFGIWADRKTDIRLKDGKIMINFLNVEVYDFETGEQLWQTSTGSDRLLDFVAPEAQIMNTFAFPVIHNNTLYRINHENAGLTGVDVVVQAFNYETGELLWKTDRISRSKAINDMLISGDHLVVSIDRSDNVMALNVETGEKVWEKSGFGKNGVQFDMMELDGNILAAGAENILNINSDTGEENYSVSASSDGLGDMTDIALHNERILITGESGFGVYDANAGSMRSSAILPTGGLMRFSEINDRVLIIPKPSYSATSYPVDGAFHLIDGASASLLGTLGTDDSRRKWHISPDYSNIYVLKNDVVIMYSPN